MTLEKTSSLSYARELSDLNVSVVNCKKFQMRIKHIRKFSHLTSLQCIWDHAAHNAFTDLIYFKEAFFCCFREGAHHASGENGTIRILKSKDSLNWKSVALLKMPSIDLRDPHFSETTDNRLMLSMGGSRFINDTYVSCHPHVSFSTDGETWDSIISIPLANEWIWRVTWHKGIGYGISYRLSDPSHVKKPWIATLFRTIDGVSYEVITDLDISQYPSEGTVRFAPDDSMICLIRRQGSGFIGLSKPPYETWQWFDAKMRLGGPNFLLLPNGEMWAGSRIWIKRNKKHSPHTALFQMRLNKLKPWLILPSGGDTSYPGMVYQDKKLFFSYYSSHEEKAKIYLAIVS